MCSNVGRVAALGHNASIGPYCAVCVELLLAIRLIVVLALAAFEAGVRLCADTDALTLLDQRHLGAYTERLSDDLCERRVSWCVRGSQRLVVDLEAGGGTAYHGRQPRGISALPNHR